MADKSEVVADSHALNTSGGNGILIEVQRAEAETETTKDAALSHAFLTDEDVEDMVAIL